MARRKDLRLDGNGGRFAAFSADEATPLDLTDAPLGTPADTLVRPDQTGLVDIDDLWGDKPTPDELPEQPVAPEPPPPAPDPLPKPEASTEVTDDFPQPGEPSGLYSHYAGYKADRGDDPYSGPIGVTPWNRDLLAGLTQLDIDNRTDTWRDAIAAETERLANRVTAEDITLPQSPTAKDLQRVAVAIDEAFTERRLMDGSQDPRTRARKVLAEVYGTEDRAIVALGTAVANRADELAGGYAAGGAEATEKWWLQRREELEAAEMAAYEHRVAEGRDTHGMFVRSPDLQHLENARDEKTMQALEDMTDAYLKALAEVRPVGGELKLHDKSAKPGAKVMSSTAGIWPADWLEVHNTNETPLHIGASNSRGHYVHHSIERMKTRGQGTEILLGRTDVHGQMRTEPKYNGYTWHRGSGVYTRAMTFFDPMSDEEKATRWPDKPHYETANAVVGKEWDVRSVEDMANQIEWDRSRRGDAAARATTRGWEQATDPAYNNGEPFWRKKKIRANSEGFERVSQIKLSSSGSGLPRRDPRYPVAVHEFGHRMEYLVPNLSQMTHTWRQRRVAESPTEDGRTLTAIYRGTREKGFRDSWAEHYVGKVYSHGTNGATADGFLGATEVFSMGSDSVFGGRQGGLIGLSRTHPPDPDMRAFILGCFATAGMAKRNV